MVSIATRSNKYIIYTRIRLAFRIIFMMAIIILLSWGCEQHVDNNEFSKKHNHIAHNNTSLLIQPIGNFPPSSINLVASKLKAIYPGRIIVSEPINPPKSCLSSTKKRYSADSLISYLRTRSAKRCTTVGITNLDISSKKGKNSDYGIFGLSFCPGKACVISSFRIKGKNKIEKLYKVILHEIGHTQGLNHCPLNNCFMRDAKGKDHLNEETDFCKNCKLFFTRKGWNL